MTLLSRPEFNMLSNLVGSINMLGAKVPELIKAIEGMQPTSNHQRQVAALQRQSEAVVYIDEILVYVHNHSSNGDDPQFTREEFHSALVEVHRMLKVLRKDLTG